jgi:hypothetical protein
MMADFIAYGIVALSACFLIWKWLFPKQKKSCAFCKTDGQCKSKNTQD